jgi:hypothetical protein
MRNRFFQSIVAAILCLLATNPARAEEVSAPTPDVLLMLVRTTLVALNQANFTGNYAVLHALGTPRLQAMSSPVQLGIAFTNLREQRIDLSRVLLLAPELTEPPNIAPDGTLRLVGVFRTSPVQVAFVTVFKPVAGIWRIDGLSVRTLPAPAPAASARTPIPVPERKGL